jgi:YD repeat-containing protein
LGRKSSQSDPDLGTWSYAYDGNGNLSTQTDAKGQKLIFTYDPLNRIKTKSYAAVSTGPDTTPPTAPTNVTATAAGGNQIDLAWTSSEDNVAVTGYQVERCQGAVCNNFATSSAAPAFSDASVTLGASYSYRVLAVDAAGNIGPYSDPVTILFLLPDLVSTALSASLSGNSVLVNDTVKNQGGVAAEFFTIKFYLSINTTYESQTDIPLCSRNVLSLAAGSSDPPSGTTTTTCPIPSGGGGNYYVVEVIDKGAQVVEITESNNIQATGNTVPLNPDVRPTALAATVSGRDIVIMDAVTNRGNMGAVAFTIGFYLSTNQTYDPGTDVPLCSRTVSSLAVGASSPPSWTTSTTCPIPADVGGVFYVLVVDDSGNVLTESNELNNSLSTDGPPLFVGPDLLPTALTALISGSDIVINDSLINQGNTAAGNFTIGFYLSTNTTYEAGADINFNCSRNVNLLAAGASNPASGTTTTTCPIPAGVGGSYYILAVADAGSAVAESNESNDTQATTGPLPVGPDLLPKAQVTAATSGSNLVITDSAKNQGNTAAGSFAIRFYLSTNTTYETGTDINFNCSRTVSGLAAGASNPTSGTTTTTCSASAIPPGIYYVLMVTDGGTQVAEANETNNIMATAGALILGPDLLPMAFNASIAGTTITITDRVKNQGSTSAGSFAIRFYLSTNTTYEAGTDINFNCSRTVSGLAAGASNPTSGTTTTTCSASAIPPGIYYVLMVTDGGTQVAEANETNNIQATTGTIGVGMTAQDRLPTSASGLGPWLKVNCTAPYDCVNDPIGSWNTTSYIQSPNSPGNLANFQSSAFTVPAGKTILYVRVTYVAINNNASGTADIRGALRVNGTTYDQPTVQALSSTWTMSSYAWTTNPDTGAAWTIADVNGTGTNPLQSFGVSSGNGDESVTQIYLTVAYN